MKIYKGSVIDIIAPSTKPENCPTLLQDVANYVLSLGYKPRISPNIFCDDSPLYANTEEYRAQALKDALMAEDSNIIWALKGGRGALETLPFLNGDVINFDGLPNVIPENKLLIGFSDITTLHSYLIQKYNIATLHADMLERIVTSVVSKDSVTRLENLLKPGSDEFLTYKLTKISPNPVDKIEGKVLGGNLTLVQTAIGLPYALKYEDSFLFLEDVNGRAQQIERSLTQLLLSGSLHNTKAVLFGDFSNETGLEPYVDLVEQRFVNKMSSIKDIASCCNIFTIKGIGHTSTNNPIFFNTSATIFCDADNQYYIKIKNPLTII